MMRLLIFIFCVTVVCVTAQGQNDRGRKSKRGEQAAAEKGLIKVSVMYPPGEGKSFDMAYYETTHMPMVARLLGDNLVRYTIEKGLSSGIPNQPLPFVAIGTFYVTSLSDYQSAIAPNRDAIRADIAKYTNISPVILVSKVVR